MQAEGDHARRTSILKAIVAFGIVSTGLHFTHNFVAIEQYPPAPGISNTLIQAAIVISWPAFTAIAVLGYRLYSRRRYGPAHNCVLAYALFCLVSLGHFTAGVPDIAPFWFATVFTDVIAGLAGITFTLWSVGATSASG